MTAVAGAPSAWSPFGTETHRCRALVLDASTAVRRALVTTLSRLGYAPHEVAAVADPDEAVRRFEGEAPPVVFLELEDAGASLVEDLLDKRPEARIILVTAAPRHDPEVRRAVKAGAFAWIEKPLRADRVRQVLLEIDQEEGGVERMR